MSYYSCCWLLLLLLLLMLLAFIIKWDPNNNLNCYYYFFGGTTIYIYFYFYVKKTFSLCRCVCVCANEKFNHIWLCTNVWNCCAAGNALCNFAFFFLFEWNGKIFTLHIIWSTPTTVNRKKKPKKRQKKTKNIVLTVSQAKFCIQHTYFCIQFCR